MLTFKSLAVTLRTTRFKIKKLRLLITLHLCVLCGSQNKQKFFPYTALTDWFFITMVESVYSAVRIESLYNTDTIRLEGVNITLFTLLHCYMFQPSRGLPQGILIHFVSAVNTIRVQMYGSQNIFTCKLYCLLNIIEHNIKNVYAYKHIICLHNLILCIYALYIIFYSQYNLHVRLAYIYIWTRILSSLHMKCINIP